MNSLIPKHGLKVAIVSNQRIFETIGGIESYTNTLCQALSTFGHQPVVICRTLSKILPIFVSKCESKNNNIVHVSKREKKGGNALLYILQQVIFSFLLLTNLLQRARNNELDVIHAQEVYFSGFISALAGRIAKRPVVVHCHGSNELPTKNRVRNFEWFVHRVLFTITLKLCDKIIATDPVTANLLIQEGVKPTRISILPTFINPEKFRKEFTRRLKSDDPAKYVIGYIGRLVKIKRIDILIEATAILRNQGVKVETVIVGDGNFSADLKKLAKKFGIINHVLFVGEQEDIAPFLNKMDVFVLPSESEGCPISILEAMACGIPLVVSKIPSLEYLLTDNEARFFNPGSSQSLSDILKALLLDENKREKMKISELKKIEEFSVSRIVGKVIDEYLNIKR